MHNVIAFVLGGGRGTRLYPLTKYRAKPAVPLAGKYRLIDIPLSNCINSRINQMYVLTQFLSVSLHRHIRNTYRFDHFSGGFVEILAAQQTMEEDAADWYQGTADAVRKNLRYIEQPGVEHVLILSGDQLYRMDYRDMLRTHEESGADVTIAALPVASSAASGLGIMRVDDSGRVVGFLEKPKTGKELEMVRMDPAWIEGRGLSAGGRDCLASMGIYVFRRDTLLDVLTKTAYQDFGREVFPTATRARRVQVHLFDGYWEDIGTIRAYYEANLSLAGSAPPFDLGAPEAPVYTRARFLPPTHVAAASVTNTLVAEGCRIGRGAVVENSVLGLRSVIGRNAVIRNSVLLGNDWYETNGRRQQGEIAGRPPLGVGEGAVIEGAILDKNCRIGSGARIVNEKDVEESPDAADCIIRDRIPVVLKDAVLGDRWRM
jgi:glucose-1-phosphate adenylyltransferase